MTRSEAWRRLSKVHTTFSLAATGTETLRDARFTVAAVRPFPDHSGLLCVVDAPDLPFDLKARLIAALGQNYSVVEIDRGRVSRSPAGKLLEMLRLAS